MVQIRLTHICSRGHLAWVGFAGGANEQVFAAASRLGPYVCERGPEPRPLMTPGAYVSFPLRFVLGRFGGVVIAAHSLITVSREILGRSF